MPGSPQKVGPPSQRHPTPGRTRPLDVADEADLLARLRPDVDGLILQDGDRRGIFLPSVWSGLPKAEAFVAQLKRKAGLPVDHWSDAVRVSRYTTESFGAGYQEVARA